MPLSHSARLGTLAGAMSLGMLSLAAPAQAGLLEFLFGGDEPAPRYYGPPPQNYGPSHQSPIDVRVNPRRRPAPGPQGGAYVPHNGAPRGVATAPGANPWEPKRVLAKSIDPVKNPNWYLEDPTLRRGDIVVLKGQVLVFDGGRVPVTPAAYTALNKSPLLSKGEKTRIEQMADTSGPAAPEAPKAAPNKEAALTKTQ